jgi:ribonuclease HI
MEKVELYTDGSCDTNTGSGGWAFLLRHTETGRETSIAGKEDDSTNNRMELSAVIEGLKRLDRRCEVHLVSDSKYVLDGLRTWIHNWKKNGWKKADKKPVKNQDLWMQLDELRNRHKIRYHWVKGHNDHPENEQVDRMALEVRNA